jgi:hypothetical protein
MEIGHGIPPLAQQVSASYARQAPADRRTPQAPAAPPAREDIQDAYIPSNPNGKKATYSKPTGAPNTETIARLKAESERVYSHLKDMVRQLLERQGLTFQEVAAMSEEERAAIEVDETTRTEAAAMIGEGGALSPENVSDNIVAFAKALSGEDKSKLSLLRQAIEDGFSEAEKAWGGELPEISKKTYDLVMEKLDAWEKGAPEAVAAE